jgi:hypothetical protein
MNRYCELYRRAIDAESRSESPRIKSLHARGLHCRVSLGVTDERRTARLFISRNPGGDYNQPQAQTTAERVQTGYDMANYIEESFPHARNLKSVIRAYADWKGIDFGTAARGFGLTNLSFFHSTNTERMKESFGVEICIKHQGEL